MKPKNLTLEEMIKFYDTYLRSEGKSPATLSWYNQTLHSLLGWLRQTGHPVTINSIDERTVREFVLWYQESIVRGHKITTMTVNNRVRALRAFFNWLYRQERFAAVYR
jgi:site-specific recombinase XerC